MLSANAYEPTERRAVATRFGVFLATRFRHGGSGESALALSAGELRGDGPLLTRVHS